MTASSSPLSVGYETSAGPKPPGCSAARSASFSSNAFAAALSRPPRTAPSSIETAARMRGSFEKSSPAAISGSVKRSEVGEDRDGDRAGGDDAEVGLGPGGAVVRAERDLVAAADAGLAQGEAGPLDRGGELAVGEAAAVEVGEGG